MKYFIYCRVSSDREDRQVLGIPSQKKELIEYAMKYDLEVVDVLEEDSSAYKPGRKIFNEMMSRIQAGEAEGIIVWHLTRLARNPLDGGRIIHFIDEGVLKEIRTKEKVYHNTTNDKFMMHIELSMSKKSSDDTSDFVKRDNLTKVQKGEYPGIARLGYLNISKDGVISGKRFDTRKQELLNQLDRPIRRIELDPLLKDPLRKFFEKAMTGAYNLAELREIAHELRLAGRISGKKLAKSEIQRMLSDPFYYGEFLYKDKLWPGVHEPIITKAESEKIQGFLSQRSRPKFHKRGYSLSTMIKCGTCGNWLSGDYQKGRYYYRCSHAKGRDAICTNTKHYREDALEQQIFEIFSQIDIPLPIIEWAIKQLKKSFKIESKMHSSARKDVHKQINEANQRLDTLSEKWLSYKNKDGQLLSDEEYQHAKLRIKSEIKNLEKIYAANKAQNENWVNKAEDFFKLSRKMINSYQAATLSEKRTLLKAVGGSFILKDHKLALKLNIPFSYTFTAVTNLEHIRTAEEGLNKSYKPSPDLENAIWLGWLALVRQFFRYNSLYL